MDAPLYNALCALRGQKGLRMHMPGHKGKSPAAEFSAVGLSRYTGVRSSSAMALEKARCAVRSSKTVLPGSAHSDNPASTPCVEPPARKKACAAPQSRAASASAAAMGPSPVYRFPVGPISV